MTLSNQLCTFFTGGQLFGIEVARVQEIIRDQPMTPIPHAPSSVTGLINLRGQIVPIIDLRRCLKLPPRASDAQASNVVLSTDSGPVSLRVDTIGDVLELSEESFEPPPENLSSAMRLLIRGVYKLNQQILLVLSPEIAIDVAVSQGTLGGDASHSISA